MPQTAPISVIIPAYNGERYIRQAIRSVQKQTLSVAEIIVVDDGCTDRTAEIARKMGVTVLEKREKNQGVAAARNRGIQTSCGEWVALLDQDDYWHKRKIEYQWAAIKARPDAGLISSFSNLVVTNPSPTAEEMRNIEILKNWLRKSSTPEDYQSATIDKYCSYFPKVDARILNHGYLIPSTVIFSRNVISEIGFFNEELQVSDDTEFFLRVLGNYPWLFLHRTLATYRRHENNTSKNFEVFERDLDVIIRLVCESQKSYPEGVTEVFLNKKKLAFLSSGQRTAQDYRTKSNS